MSMYRKVCNDYSEEKENEFIIHIDAWKTFNDDEGGETVAFVIGDIDSRVIRVDYVENEAKGDRLVVEAILKAIEELWDIYES